MPFPFANRRALIEYIESLKRGDKINDDLADCTREYRARAGFIDYDPDEIQRKARRQLNRVII